MNEKIECLLPECAVPAPEMGDGIYKLTSGASNHKHAYHTRCPWSPDGTKLLFLRYEKEVRFADICVMDLPSGETNVVGKSDAWWSHGAASQEWVSDKEILYPKFTEGTSEMVLVKVDIASGEEVSFPYYDWGHGNVPWNLSNEVYKFDSSPLEEVLPDDKPADRATVGVKRANIATGELKLIVSIDDILAIHPQGDEIKNYHMYTKMEIPHPTKKRLLFGFVNSVYDKTYGEPRIREIYTCDWDGSDLRHVGKYFHHPMWHHTESAIIANVLDFNNKVRLGIYPDESEAMLRYLNFKGSGHPSFSPNGAYISNDDYIEKGGSTYVEVKLFDQASNIEKVIASYKMGDTDFGYTVYEAIKNRSGDDCVSSIFTKSVFNHDAADPSCSWSTQAHPVWSRDSRYLLFNADPESVSQLYVADMAGITPFINPV
jgi:hypothetical protein